MSHYGRFFLKIFGLLSPFTPTAVLRSDGMSMKYFKSYILCIHLLYFYRLLIYYSVILLRSNMIFGTFMGYTRIYFVSFYYTYIINVEIL